jgi:peptidylamidoglycolate lyase
MFAEVGNWPATELSLGNPTGLGINKAGELVVFHRAGRTWPRTGNMPSTTIDSDVLVNLDPVTGNRLKSWGRNMFIMPHGLTIDEDDNIWLTDVALHQVFKFAANGKLLMQLGEARVPGSDQSHFDQPTDVAIDGDGSFYVSDGYGNSRIIKFSASGQFLFQWGKKGKEDGEFNIPHSIDIDVEKGIIYVADRENRRIQVFDRNGGFLQSWENKSYGFMCAVTRDRFTENIIAVDDDRVVMEHFGSDIFVFANDGTVINRFGRSSRLTGPKTWYHDVVIDKDGNLYAGDILRNKVVKFRRLR